MSKMLSPRDIAKLFDVSENTVRRWIINGKIEAVSVNDGLHVYNKISVEELKRFAMTRPTYMRKFSEVETQLIGNDKKTGVVDEFQKRYTRVCPYCGRMNEGKEEGCVSTTTKSIDGYLLRYRKCKGCGVTRKTYEISEEEMERYKKLASGVQRLVNIYSEMEGR